MRWTNGDAQALPLSKDSADVLSIAFGIRNVQDPAKALSEFRRVLRPGGRLIILEFSLPTNPILRSLYNFYFRQVLPRTATLISGDKTGAYKYLPESVNTFIGRSEMMAMMRSAGFEQVEQFPMTFGVCVCYRGRGAGDGSHRMNHMSPKDVVQIAQMAIIGAGCLSFIGSIVWVTWIVRKYRQELKRSREGLCMHCGYDLRQSKERCPECGEKILARK